MAKLYLFLKKNKEQKDLLRGGWVEAEGEEESEGDSPPQVQSPVDSTPRLQDHNPSQNHESDAQPTKSPRCPKTSSVETPLKYKLFLKACLKLGVFTLPFHCPNRIGPREFISLCTLFRSLFDNIVTLFIHFA